MMLTVHDVPDRSRFELHLEGTCVGWADYHLRDRVLTVPHVETDAAHRGKGYAAVLMDAVLDAARERSLTIRPVCSYAAAHIAERPDSRDLVAR
jgi:predicted GNAT family acetyltransferase